MDPQGIFICLYGIEYAMYGYPLMLPSPIRPGSTSTHIRCLALCLEDKNYREMSFREADIAVQSKIPSKTILEAAVLGSLLQLLLLPFSISLFLVTCFIS